MPIFIYLWSNRIKLYAYYVIIFNITEHLFKHVFTWKNRLLKEGIRGYSVSFKMINVRK